MPVTPTPPAAIAEALLAWFDRHGRHDLPWQHPRSAYRVWVAEIMLQQTQVATVAAYFRAFVARFPDVATLAAAEADEVMRYWAGLGYYARARNLHRAAKIVVAEYGAAVPRDFDALLALPGIGRSTAGAIVAQAFGEWAPILDGNAKRVLARLAAVRERPGTSAYDQRLWALARAYTPRTRISDYTQAIMDLGAMVCTRHRPACTDCPLGADCLARIHGLQAEIPAARARPVKPLRHTRMLWVNDEHGRILLEKRAPTGVWGGLWSLPEADPEADAGAWCRERFGVDVRRQQELAPLRHAFTHFELEISVARMHVGPSLRIMESKFQWFARDALPGVPAPVARLLKSRQDELTL